MTFVSDNGTQFTSAEFRSFATKWNFTQVTSSPHFAQANGAAERAVRTAKEILSQEDPFLALLTYRATPIPELGVSPAELAFGRRLRTTLPTLPSTLKSRAVQGDMVRELDVKLKARQKAGYDRRQGVQTLKDLQPGDPVLAKLDGQKGWSQPAVVKHLVAPRSYLVETAGGGHLRRNRKHLRPDTALVRDAVTGGFSEEKLDAGEQRRSEVPIRGSDDTPGQRIIDTPGQRAISDTPGQRSNVDIPGRRNLALGRRSGAPEGPVDPEPLEEKRRLEMPASGAEPENHEDSSPAATQTVVPFVTRSGRTVKKPARFL